MTQLPAESSRRRTVLLTMAAVLLGGAAGAAVYLYTGPPAPAPHIQTIEKAELEPPTGAGMRPAFALPDLEGVRQDVTQWDGKVLVLNFWATWCGPCRHEIPFFIELTEKYRERGVQVVGIAIDTPDNIIPYYNEIGMNYPTLHGQSDAIDVGEAYGNQIGGLPYTVFVDRQGQIIRVKNGPIEYAELAAAVEGLL